MDMVDPMHLVHMHGGHDAPGTHDLPDAHNALVYGLAPTCRLLQSGNELRTLFLKGA